MSNLNSNDSDNRSVAMAVAYWVGFWLVALDGVWIAFKFFFQDPPSFQALASTAVGHAIYAAFGVALCLLVASGRTDKRPNFFGAVAFWTIYWTLVMLWTILSKTAGAECHNPVGAEACSQMGAVALVLMTPFLLIYFAAVSSLGNGLYLAWTRVSRR